MRQQITKLVIHKSLPYEMLYKKRLIWQLSGNKNSALLTCSIKHTATAPELPSIFYNFLASGTQENRQRQLYGRTRRTSSDGFPWLCSPATRRWQTGKSLAARIKSTNNDQLQTTEQGTQLT